MHHHFRFIPSSVLVLSLLLPAAAFSQSAGGWPRTVSDDMGASLRIAQKPQKIVSVTLPTDEILLSLVAKSRIAAVPGFLLLQRIAPLRRPDALLVAAPPEP